MTNIMKSTKNKQQAVQSTRPKAEISLIKAQMRDGDAEIVADVTGYSKDYVRKCMDERRNNKLVVAIMERLIENRKAFIKSMKAISELVRTGNYPTSK